MEEKMYPLKISRDLMAKVSYIAEKKGLTRRKLILKAIQNYIQEINVEDLLNKKNDDITENI